jgi:hypothetical protein
LGSWVDIQALSASATVICRERCQPPAEQTRSADDLNDTIIPAKSKTDTSVDTGKKAAIESLARKNVRSHSISNVKEQHDNVGLPGSADSQPSQAGPSQSPIPPAITEHSLMEPLLVEQQQTADSLYDNIRTQYSEALYLSKVCLSAKEPTIR